MLKTLRTSFSITLVIGLLLLPFAYANETIPVVGIKDGTQVQTVKKGETVTLLAEIPDGKEGDSILFEDQTGCLDMTDNNEVDSVIDENGNWSASKEVTALEDTALEIKATLNRKEDGVPNLTDFEKPEKIDIEVEKNSAVVGETVSLKAKLEPEETTDVSLLKDLKWNVTADGEPVLTETEVGEVNSIPIAEDLEGKEISINAHLDKSETGLNEDLVAETKEIKVNTDLLSVEIYPSTENESVPIKTDLGFSSEILQNGYIAPEDITKGAKYVWESKIDSEYVNGHSKKETYALYPERLGRLKVQLTVTLSDGTRLVSNPIYKEIVEQEQSLESLEIRLVASQNSDNIAVGDKVSVTFTPTPRYPTNLVDAAYNWIVTFNGTTVKETSSSDDLLFIPNNPGNYKVKFSITPKDSETITSNELDINVHTTSAQENSIKLIGAEISSNCDTTNLKAGDVVEFKADVNTQGSEGTLEYNWKASDDSGIIAQGNNPESFSVTSDKSAVVTVEFSAEVKNSSNASNDISETSTTDKATEQDLGTDVQASEITNDNYIYRKMILTFQPNETTVAGNTDDSTDPGKTENDQENSSPVLDSQEENKDQTAVSTDPLKDNSQNEQVVISDPEPIKEEVKETQQNKSGVESAESIKTNAVNNTDFNKLNSNDQSSGSEPVKTTVSSSSGNENSYSGSSNLGNSYNSSYSTPSKSYSYSSDSSGSNSKVSNVSQESPKTGVNLRENEKKKLKSFCALILISTFTLLVVKRKKPEKVHRIYL